MLIGEKEIHLIEFKTGFKQKIRRDNFDEEKGKCIHKKAVCDDYWNLFWDWQKRKINELKEVIKLKAIETYVLLDKKIFPFCENGNKKRIVLTVVIDEDNIDAYVDASASVAKADVVDDKNIVYGLRKSLSRLTKLTDTKSNIYYYDKIEVITAVEFQKKLDIS